MRALLISSTVSVFLSSAAAADKIHFRGIFFLSDQSLSNEPFLLKPWHRTSSVSCERDDDRARSSRWGWAGRQASAAGILATDREQ